MCIRDRYKHVVLSLFFLKFASDKFEECRNKIISTHGEKLSLIHIFYRVGEESSFHFEIKETRKKGHDFKDYICPDTMEFEKDYFKMGNRYGRVPFLREYASYIKDSMVAVSYTHLDVYKRQKRSRA